MSQENFKKCTDISYIFAAGEVCFNCPCGFEHFLDEGGEISKCKCGRVYKLCHYIEVDKNNKNA